jgi:2-polyprenyl-6-methoxyphenol hydroxylase-like FAD-dependent oxidoreductase
MPGFDIDVLVVGGGPVGLTAACELRRRGVACRIIDQLESPPQYAKAVGIQPRTLEVWEDMGLVRDALDAGLEMRGMAMYMNGALKATVDMELPESIPYRNFALPQYESERVLREHLARYGTEVERPVALTGFTQDADGVTATLTGPAGEETIRVGYLVGCDGAHSTVRKGLGLSFEGDAFPEEYMLGDVELDWDQPRGFAVRSMRKVEGEPDDGLVCIPLPGHKRYRVSMLVPPELAWSPDQPDEVEHGFQTERPQPTLADIQTVLDRLAPEPTTASNLRWSSIFRISHRLVDRYGEGRVFVAGDAAHIHPPTGAQGMNTGIQDSYNLAWKLALAAQGIAAPGLLESYSAERHPIGEEVVGRTVKAARTEFGMATDDKATMMLREAQLLVGYPDSALGDQDCDPGAPGPQPGQRAPDVPGLQRESVSFPLRLFELLSTPDPVLLLHAAASVDGLETLAQDARDAAHGRLTVYAILAPDVDAGQLALPFVRDAAGEFLDGYGGAGVYVIRPDGYVGYRAAQADAGRLRAYLGRLFAPGRSPGR